MSGKYWTEQINPVSGCTHISEACANCYARENYNMHHAAKKEKPWYYSESFDKIVLQPDQLKKFDRLARKKEPQVVFVGNMTDLFHDDVPDDYIREVFGKISSLGEIGKPGRHTFIILTKRAKRMKEFFEHYPAVSSPEGRQYAMERYMQHVWLGVTAENQARADERIPLLLETPAAHRWVSCEPLLGSINLNRLWMTRRPCPVCRAEDELGESRGTQSHPINCGWRHDNGMGGSGIDLVIVGGESGRKARETKQEWFESLYQQCRALGTRFYFKQKGDAYKDMGLPLGCIAEDAYEQPFIGRVVA